MILCEFFKNPPQKHLSANTFFVQAILGENLLHFP